MDEAQLKKFDLTYPGIWIVDSDRNKAFDTRNILGLVESAFVRAVASYAMFKPLTTENVRQHFDQPQPKYERCLNSIYAEMFVYSLDVITKLLKKLESDLSPPDTVKKFIAEYDNCFGKLKHIRDSAIHIEDRGRGLDKDQNKLQTPVVVLGGLNERWFEFTASDGNRYKVEVSETTLQSAQKIIQAIINAYPWE